MAITASKSHAHDAESRQDRRAQLVEATMEAIRQFGISRVTVAKVASLAGLSPGIVNFYFQSKEQLLLDTLRTIAFDYEQAVRGALDRARGAEESLLAIVDVNLDEHILNPRTASVWYAFWGESQARQDYLRIFGEREAAMQARIFSFFESLREAGTRTAVNAKAVARAFDALIDSFWEDCMADPEGFDRAASREMCVAYLNSVFPGRFERRCPEVDPPPERTRADGEDRQDIQGMLAPWTYRNPELFDVEMEAIFKRQWLLVGHASELDEVGDYLTFDAAGERALVVRDRDGGLNAFHNVCRHRGSRVVEGTRGRCRRSIVCPFHGWTYNLDGSLKSVPAFKTFAGLDKTRHGLVPLDVEVWHGFVFVRFQGEGASLAEQLAPVEHLVAPYRMADMKPLGGHYRKEYDYNWKIIHDVDNEGYHVPMAHPSLQQLYGKTYRDLEIDGVAYSTGTVDERPAKLWSVGKYKKLLPRFDHLPERHQRLWLYVGVFPNLVFAIYLDMMEFYMTVPLSVGR
ncbi:MAG: TetR family transcriptional regulator, partial [Proteobacteria bacterium]